MREAFFAFVVNAIWQVALTAGLGLVLARFLRSAGQRFAFLALTLVACVAAPALTLVPRGTVAVVEALDLPPIQTRGADAISVVYLAGLGFVFLRLIIAASRAWRLVAASVPLRRGVRVSHVVPSPLTIGRVVLLPPAIAGDRRLRAAAIAHEHAHVRRKDYVLHVALELLALPLYFHPMVFILRRAIAEAREMACDDLAAQRRGRKQYAEELVQLASLAARPRTNIALGIAATSIERRVAALLGPRAHQAQRHAFALLILPLVVAMACTRFNAAPAVREASLGGRWALIAEASDYRETERARYDAFVQTIEQGPTRISVRQQRTIRGRTKAITWSVMTDGVTRPVDGIRGTQGSARWDEGKLRVQMVGPGGHRESATASIRDERLVVDGHTERGRYHAEFRRIDP